MPAGSSSRPSARARLHPLDLMPMPHITHIVTQSHVSKRLDIFIAHFEPHLSRSRIQALIREGLARVGGRIEKAGYKVKQGEQVTLELPERTVRDVLPEPIPLSVIYEDAHLIVLNKPPGLVVHPAPGNYTGTLVNALLYHYGSLPSSGPVPGGTARERAGIVHRLDKDTSGIMVVARSQEALSALSAQFKARVVQKKYLALVAGVIKKGSGTIDAGLGRHVKERKKISVQTLHAREAVTLFRVKERFPNATLVEVEIKTGRTHQIRVHMAHLGHPVLGDSTYGGGSARQGAVNAPRQMLHAESLSLLHPATGHPMTFSAPPPPDMAGVIETLRAKGRGERT